jgi:hypothetical protein
MHELSQLAGAQENIDRARVATDTVARFYRLEGSSTGERAKNYRETVEEIFQRIHLSFFFLYYVVYK